MLSGSVEAAAAASANRRPEGEARGLLLPADRRIVRSAQ